MTNYTLNSSDLAEPFFLDSFYSNRAPKISKSAIDCLLESFETLKEQNTFIELEDIVKNLSEKTQEGTQTSNFLSFELLSLVEHYLPFNKFTRTLDSIMLDIGKQVLAQDKIVKNYLEACQYILLDKHSTNKKTLKKIEAKYDKNDKVSIYDFIFGTTDDNISVLLYNDRIKIIKKSATGNFDNLFECNFSTRINLGKDITIRFIDAPINSYEILDPKLLLSKLDGFMKSKMEYEKNKLNEIKKIIQSKMPVSGNKKTIIISQSLLELLLYEGIVFYQENKKPTPSKFMHIMIKGYHCILHEKNVYIRERGFDTTLSVDFRNISIQRNNPNSNFELRDLKYKPVKNIYSEVIGKELGITITVSDTINFKELITADETGKDSSNSNSNDSINNFNSTISSIEISYEIQLMDNEIKTLCDEILCENSYYKLYGNRYICIKDETSESVFKKLIEWKLFYEYKNVEKKG